MPAISMFFGIVIKMFYGDHRPPHFHGEYQGQKGLFTFDGKQMAGNMTSKVALRLIKQWAAKNKVKLTENWKNVESGKPLNIIEPLN